MNKAALRQSLSIKRRELSAEQRLLASRRVAELLVAHPQFQHSQHVACYFAKADELTTEDIIGAIWQAGKICYLPCLTASSKELVFKTYHAEDELTLNRYQIPEPTHGHLISPKQLDLVCVPLLGFDQSGNRLGMGAGFYDRTFAFLSEGLTRKPFMLGLAFACQRWDVLPSDPWDIPLDAVLTEEGWVRFGIS